MDNSCVGDERSFSHISSKLVNLADKALTASLMEINNSKFYNFQEVLMKDNIVPGIDFACTFCKSKFGEYQNIILVKIILI